MDGDDVVAMFDWDLGCGNCLQGFWLVVDDHGLDSCGWSSGESYRNQEWRAFERISIAISFFFSFLFFIFFYN